MYYEIFQTWWKKKNWSVSCNKVQTLNSVIYQLNFEILWKCIRYAII